MITRPKMGRFEWELTERGASSTARKRYRFSNPRYVSSRDLGLDAALLAEYGLEPETSRDERDRAYTAGEVLLACAEKLVETLLIDHPTLALNLAAALSRDLVHTKTAASKPLKRKFLAHRRRHRRLKRTRAKSLPPTRAHAWLAWIRGSKFESKAADASAEDPARFQ